MIAPLLAIALVDPCEARDGRPFVGPAEISVRDGELGAPRAPCAERSVGVSLRALALIDTPEFRGGISASSTVSGRFAFGRLELGAAARVYDWTFAQTASVQATETSSGPLWLSLLRSFVVGDGRRVAAIAPALRVQVPLTTTASGNPTGAVEPALFVGLRPAPCLSVFGHVAAIVWAVAPPGAIDGRGAVAFGGGAGATPWRWVRASGGLEVQSGWYGRGLDHVLTRLAVGVPTRAGTLSLAGAAPLHGAERTDFAAMLSYMLSL